MARTYTYADVLGATSQTTNRNIEDKFAAIISNLATDFIWNEYDFRETVAELPPFYLIPNEQDHGPPFSCVPSDFMGLRKAFLVQMTSAPPMRTELNVLKDLRQTHLRALPHAVGYVPEFSAFRVFPRVPENVGAPDYLIDGSYKKRPTKITPADLNVALPFDDLYLRVWLETARWAAWYLAGDQRAGGVSVMNGQRAYSGQLASAKEAVDWMAANEGLNDGDPAIAPSEPLVGPVFGQGVWGSLP